MTFLNAAVNVVFCAAWTAARRAVGHVAFDPGDVFAITLACVPAYLDARRSARPTA